MQLQVCNHNQRNISFFYFEIIDFELQMYYKRPLKDQKPIKNKIKHLNLIKKTREKREEKKEKKTLNLFTN